jgi:hypothetical protein
LHPSRQHESADPEAGRGKNLNPLAAIRRVGNDEGGRPFNRERRRIDDRPASAPIITTWRDVVIVASMVNTVCATLIEHVVLAVFRLLKAERVANWPAMCGGTAPTDRIVSGLIATSEIVAKRTTAAVRTGRTESPRPNHLATLNP